MTFLTIAEVGDIPDGEGQAISVGSRRLAVFNRGGVYTAIDDMCPHMGASLAAGYLEDCEVSCPLHAWRFDVRDGTWCDNRRIRIDSFELRVVDDQIQVPVDDAGEPLVRELEPEPPLTETKGSSFEPGRNPIDSDPPLDSDRPSQG